jgi:hypothetical protein
MKPCLAKKGKVQAGSAFTRDSRVPSVMITKYKHLSPQIPRVWYSIGLDILDHKKYTIRSTNSAPPQLCRRPRNHDLPKLPPNSHTTRRRRPQKQPAKTKLPVLQSPSLQRYPPLDSSGKAAPDNVSQQLRAISFKSG